MNLENFPTSESARRMIGSVTEDFYETSYVGKWLYQVMGTEMDSARARFEELQYQPFAESATWAIMYHEMMFGITPKAGATLEERRSAIINHRDIITPLNPARLEAILTNLTGVKVEVIENIKTYTFLVKFDCNESEFYNLQEAYRQIRELKPSHLSFMWGFLINVPNKNWIAVKDIHRLKMSWWQGLYAYLDGSRQLDGSWRLGNGIKLNPVRDTHRLKTQLTEHISGHLINKVNYWQLNGEYVLDGRRTLGAEIREEAI